MAEKLLTLTEDQFESLHFVVADTVEFIKAEGDDLNESLIYEVYKKLEELK